MNNVGSIPEDTIDGLWMNPGIALQNDTNSLIQSMLYVLWKTLRERGNKGFSQRRTLAAISRAHGIF